MSSFQAETKNWRRNEMTERNYQDIENIIADNGLLELAASCLALEDEENQPRDFKLRVKEILETPQMHLESALYLVYHKAETKEKAARLFKEMIKKSKRVLSAQST